MWLPQAGRASRLPVARSWACFCAATAFYTYLRALITYCRTLGPPRSIGFHAREGIVHVVVHAQFGQGRGDYPGNNNWSQSSGAQATVSPGRMALGASPACWGRSHGRNLL